MTCFLSLSLPPPLSIVSRVALYNHFLLLAKRSPANANMMKPRRRPDEEEDDDGNAGRKRLTAAGHSLGILLLPQFVVAHHSLSAKLSARSSLR